MSRDSMKLLVAMSRPKLFESVCMYTIGLLCFLTTHCLAVKPEVVLEQTIWISGEDAEIAEYRTPVIIQALNGDLLAFVGARKTSKGDASAKVIMMRRSKDGGSKWGPSVFVVDDYKNTDGLNLGNVIIDEEKRALIIIYSFCNHNKCDFSKFAPTNYKTVHGYTWSAPVDLANKSSFFKGWNWSPWPGYGIQKKLSPHVGRLLSCGHWANTPKWTYGFMACIYSDDHGETWTRSEFVFHLPNNMTKKNGDFTPGEPQIVELSDGSLLINSRNTHSFHSTNRLIFYSTDGGHTFPLSQMRVDMTLTDPKCDASILLHQGVMFFSNPNNKSKRVNMTLRWSLDEGLSWAGSLDIYSKESGYSCLAAIDKNHLGLLFEKDGCKEMYFVKIKLLEIS